VVAGAAQCVRRGEDAMVEDARPLPRQAAPTSLSSIAADAAAIPAGPL
jgi:hypothetical protein